MSMLRMDDIDLTNQRVLIREDLNVPMHDGKISDMSRINRALPTLKKAIAQHAKVMVLSHLGRPEEGKFDDAFSLRAVADALGDALGQEVQLVADWIDGIDVQPGQVVLCENVRFLTGEKQNDAALAKKMAAQCDVFVMDAFATAHRAQASTAGVAEYAPIACAGPLLVEELDALQKVLDDPARPLVAVVGGSKVSTKIQVLDALLDKVDVLIVGGGIANTFLKAQGYNIGTSLCEDEWVDQANDFLKRAKTKGVNVPLPIDVAVAKEFSEHAKARVALLDDVKDDEMILDVGPQTAATYGPLMQTAKTILWNGPVGVFEFPAFSNGTEMLGKAIADSHAFSVAGGGDTLAALAKFNLTATISYISTGGGAFLELVEGKTLPAVTVLENRA